MADKTEKQKLQQEYAWLVARAISALDALNAVNKFAKKHNLTNYYELRVPGEEHIRFELKLAFKKGIRKIDNPPVPKEKPIW